MYWYYWMTYKYKISHESFGRFQILLKKLLCTSFPFIKRYPSPGEPYRWRLQVTQIWCVISILI